MGYTVVVIVLFVIWVIRMVMASQEHSGAVEGLQDELAKGLELTITPDELTLDDESGGTLPIYRVTVTGTIYVPADQTPCRITTRIRDVTEGDGEDDILPVFCRMGELASEDGCYEHQIEVTVPHQISGVEGMDVAMIPKESLYLAKRGKRILEVVVFGTHVDDAEDEEIFFFGTKRVGYKQKGFGYMESAEFGIEADQAVTGLALAVSAGDGSIDKTELAALQQYLNERIGSARDEEEKEERKKSLQGVYKKMLREIKHSTDRRADFERYCNKILSLDSDDFTQDAYELCVKIVAADGVVEDAELRVLKLVVRLLKIPPELDQELRDRHLRLNMFQETNLKQAIDVPMGMTAEDEKAFLNKEYKKWRARVNHSDTNVREEAETRLAEITRRRKELESMASN
jgi:hypothetical protein